MSLIPYGRQCIDEDDIDAVSAVLRSDYLTTGPAVEAFEKELSSHVDAEHSIVCSSGTAALHLAMLALNLEKGDRVIVPSMTFAATANAVRYVGGEVIFADVDPDTGIMRPGDFEAALEKADGHNVRAVMPVHYAGQCADMSAIAEIANAQNISVIDDASHAIGAKYQGEGSDWAIGCCEHSTATIFSFHPVKTIAMGEGGAVTTKDAEFARRLRRFREHGIERDPSRFVNQDAREYPWYYELVDLGFNYRATDIQCALGLSQLGKLDKFISRRAELVARYDQLIKPLSPTVLPIGRVGHCTPAWHLYPVLIDFSSTGHSREYVMQTLREQGVGSQVHYIPLHTQPYYKDRYGEISLPGTELFYDRVLSLPLYPQLTANDQDRVSEALASTLKQ